MNKKTTILLLILAAIAIAFTLKAQENIDTTKVTEAIGLVSDSTSQGQVHAKQFVDENQHKFRI